ncbi:MAG TPA: BTAD domain-containing putative transcriptional regulator [Gaiellaceae bacterium]|nr:BTAD domain-containing putative transcriptional regulator [Gaiellaceae bacterium]
MPRDELAQLLWGDELPATWEKALRVLMTKLRALLEECGIDGSSALTSAFGCYQLTLPPDTWIDVDAAASAVERAEADLASGSFDDACAEAATAAELARRSFLPGEDGQWVEDQRRDLRDLLVRALECQRDASFAAGKFGDALRYANEIIELEPFRESSYRALMQAHAAAGNPAEALRVYERCRRFLADELGVYPSPETEAVYLEILRNPPSTSASVGRLGEEGSPPPAGDAPPPRGRRRRRAFVAGALVVAAGAAAALALAPQHKPPLKLLPTSLVRLDPVALKPTKVIEIGPRPDLVMVSGGYVWVTHGVLRFGSGGHTNKWGAWLSGDRILERIDPSTGKKKTVGLTAPCGMTPDTSGDPWVANCYADGSGDVVRVDAKTTKFVSPNYPVPHSKGFIRGMVYGGRSLWVSPAFAADGHFYNDLTRVTPGARKPVEQVTVSRPPGGLAWDKRHGDLWMTSGAGPGSATRWHVKGRGEQHVENVADLPVFPLVRGDEVWLGDWNYPALSHFSAARRDNSHSVHLDVKWGPPAGVTSVAAGFGYIWATVPDDHALFRINPKTLETKRIPLRYYPWGVAVGEHGIWVTLRGQDGPPDPES